MMLAAPVKALIWEDSTPTFLARLLVADASKNKVPALASNFASITYAVRQGPTVIAAGALTVADVIHDTLQTGTIWEKRNPADPGFNFEYTMAAGNFPTGGVIYRVRFTFTLTSGAVFHLVWKVETQPLTEDGEE